MIPGSAENIKPPVHVSEVEPQDKPLLPAAAPAIKRNQHLKVEAPKSEQCTGRATVAEKERIIAAINAHKVPDQTYDIVRLCLDMLDHIENDWLQTFKTK